jgi:VWFA-related protein
MAAMAATALLRAGQPPQGDPIRSAVELVRLDFAALSHDGQPVTDLAAADVALEVDGRRRDIRSFQYVRLAPAPSSMAPPAPVQPLPPPFGTNALGDAGRTIVIIIETDSIRANIAQQATSAAAEFVAALPPRDRVALVTMPYGGVLVEPTRNHESVLKALPAISGHASQQVTESEKSCRTRNTLTALAEHFAGLAHVDGPKTIVFVSSGMLTPRRDAPMTGPPGPCEIRPSHYDEVGAAANLARANVYVVKPDDLVIDSAKNAFADPAASRFRSSDEELAGIESLAGVTSGVLLRLTPADRSAFARIARESAGYYLIGFEPRPGERNGAPHRVVIDVARPSTRVKVLPTVTIARADGKRPSLTPQAMLRDGRIYTDLPLRVVGLASPSPGDAKLTVLGLVEPIDRSAVLDSAAFGLIDARGRLVAQWTANARELAASPAMSAGLASPGRYRLKVAAIDRSGRRGSAEYELVAESLTANGLELSAMILGVSYERNFVPKLQFAAEPTANGYFELVGTPPAGKLSVAMELSAGLEGPPMVRVPGTIAETRDPDRRRATGVVPIGRLAAGDYVFRAVLSLDGRPIATLTRILRKAAA